MNEEIKSWLENKRNFEEQISRLQYQGTPEIKTIDDKKPTIYSDRTQFRVILPNINYGIDTNEPNSSIYLTKKEVQVFNIIKNNANVIQKQLSLRIGLSLSTIKRILLSLSENRYIERTCGTRGYWKVLKEIEE